MSSATMTASNLADTATAWRNARRLYPIYMALNQECNLGQAPCRDLESPIDRHDADSTGRVRDWLEKMDSLIQVHQLRQVLQSTPLADEEVLRAMLKRQLDKSEKTDAVRDKVDYLLVQYYAYCAPQDGHNTGIDHDHVAEVLEPILGYNSSRVPESCRGFEKIIDDLKQCTSIGHLLEKQIFDRSRTAKDHARADYFHPAVLVAHARLNFLMRRGLFRLIHADLHAIRLALHTMEARGQKSCDCSSAGLGTDQSFADLRELCHQWNRPSRASYSLGNTFAQLVAIRTAVEAAAATPMQTESAVPQIPFAAEAISGFAPAEEAEPDAEAEPTIMMGSLAEAEPAIKAQPLVPVATTEEAEAITPQAPTKEAEPVAEVASEKEAIALFEVAEIAHSVAMPGPQQEAAPITSVAEPKKMEPVADSEPTPHVSPVMAALAGAARSPQSSPVRAALANAKKAKSATPAQPEAQTSATQPETPKRITQPEVTVPAKEPDPVQSCIAEINEILANTPGKSESLLCNFKLGETKLAFASWEVNAFMKPWTDGAPAMRRAAAVRALLIQAMDKRKKGESVDVAAAITRAHSFAAELQEQIASAKDRNEIDTAVHMAATSKRLLALVEQAEKGK